MNCKTATGGKALWLLALWCAGMLPARAGGALTVNSLKDFENAATNAVAGAIIQLADGEYSTKHPIRIERRQGTEAAPITIRAEHRGKAIIAGTAGFALKDCEHLVLEGFTLAHDADLPAVLLDDCRHVRVSRNYFRPKERATPRHVEHWVYAIGARSAHNRIDHNEFGRKVNRGTPAFVRGDDATLKCSQHDVIDHNYFHDVVNANGENMHETVRTGGNDLGASGQSSFTLIEDNLFDQCSGEGEIISLKSSDNTVRCNTFINCFGDICLRLGNRDVICGNFMIAHDGQKGRGGVKVYGYEHRIFNNYFQGLTGKNHEAPLGLIPGVFATPTTDQLREKYKDNTTVPPTRVWIAYNTWVDCSPLQFGLKEDKERKQIPVDCTFVNNLVVHTQPQKTPLIDLQLIKNFIAHGNLGYAAGAPLPAPWAAWFRWEDPKLQQSAGGLGLWRLSDASPARHAAVENGAPPAEDIYGRPRAAKSDVGAEEFSATPPRFLPLTPAQVGPEAP